MWRSPSQTFRSITSRTRDIIWGIWLVTKDLEVYYPSWNLKVSQSRPDRWVFHFLSHLSASFHPWCPSHGTTFRTGDVGATKPDCVCILKVGWTHLLEVKRKEPEGSCSSSSMWTWLRRVFVSNPNVPSRLSIRRNVGLCLYTCSFSTCSARGGHCVPHVSVYPEAPYWGAPRVGVSGVQGN